MTFSTRHLLYQDDEEITAMKCHLGLERTLRAVGFLNPWSHTALESTSPLANCEFFIRMDDLLSDYKLVTFHANQDNEIYRTHKEPNCRTHKATAYRTLKETAYMTQRNCLPRESVFVKLHEINYERKWVWYSYVLHKLLWVRMCLRGHWQIANLLDML